MQVMTSVMNNVATNPKRRYKWIAEVNGFTYSLRAKTLSNFVLVVVPVSKVFMPTSPPLPKLMALPEMFNQNASNGAEMFPNCSCVFVTLLASMLSI